jgi:D-lyxose ketol-isomerase
MEEILKKLELPDKEREEALKRCRKIVSSWGLKLPDVPPSPSHFGLNDFYRIGETEFDINNNIEQGYCGKFIFMLKGQTCPMHYHRKKHETFFIVKGQVEMELPGEKIVMKQGDRKPISQGTKHQFTAKENTLILESSKPDLVDDSIFDDERINKIIFGK